MLIVALNDQASLNTTQTGTRVKVEPLSDFRARFARRRGHSPTGTTVAR